MLPTATLEAILAQHGPRKRRPPRLSARKLLTGLVYHVSQVAQSVGATPLRVSFGRTLAALQPLWMLLGVGGDL